MLETNIFEWFLLILIAVQIPLIILFGPTSFVLLFKMWSDEYSHSNLIKKVYSFYGFIVIPALLLVFGAISMFERLGAMIEKL